MARLDEIDAAVEAIIEQVFSRLAELRELLARGRLGRLDADLGRSQGHYSRVLQPAQRRPLTEKERQRRWKLAVAELPRLLVALGLDAREYFQRFFDFDLDLYLRRLELQMDHQARAVKDRLRQTEPLAGGRQEVRRRVAKLEEERLLEQEAAKEACYGSLRALQGEGVPECEAEAWGVLAAILRKKGAYSGAAFALRSALERARAAGEWSAEARTLERASYLLADQGDLEEGIGQAKRAYLLYAEHLDFSGMGRALVDRGILSNKTGDSEGAIQQFEASLRFLPQDAWANRFAALQGLGIEHANCGQLDTAQLWLTEALELLERYEVQNPNPRDQAQWLAAEIALKRGELDTSETGFRAIRSSYLEYASPFDLAMVSLRLAKVLFVAGKIDDLRALNFRMQPLIAPLKKRNKLLGAILGHFLRLAAGGELTERIFDLAYLKLRAGARAEEAPPLPL